MTYHIEKIASVLNSGTDSAYLFDLDKFTLWSRKFLHLWKNEFKSFKAAYSYKTNSLRAVTSILKALNYSAEVTSLDELQMALEDGFSPENILVDSPYKTKDLIEYCLSNNIQMQLDNFSEIATLSEIMLKNQESFIPDVTLRIAHDIGGSISRFGFSYSECSTALNLLRSIGVTPSGIHVHFGSCIQPSKYFELLEILDRLEELGWNRSEIKRIDIGGGLPPMNEDDYSLAQQYPVALKAVLSTARLNTQNVQIQIEPGRSITEKFACIFGRVVALKDRDCGKVVFVNLGKNLLSTLGHRSKSILHHSNSDTVEINSLPYKIYGIQCFENDLLMGKFHPNFSLIAGDVIGFTNVGSYDFSTSTLWNSAHPPTYGILNGKLIRLRDSLSPQIKRKHDHHIEELIG